MSAKYILKIQTDNEFLRNKYRERVNVYGDAGVDLYCPKDIRIVNQDQSVKIDFEIRCQMVDVFSDVIDFSYMLLPRSSIVKTPLRLANSIGIIDSGYRGNIMACVDNIDTLVEDEELEYYQIKQGDRLFQIVHPSLEGIKVELVDKLPSSNRGTGGFGSTGK
jgi:dUTP pyrophosphatase